MNKTEKLPVGRRVYNTPKVIGGLDSFMIVRGYYIVGDGKPRQEVLEDGFETKNGAEYALAIMRLTGRFR